MGVKSAFKPMLSGKAPADLSKLNFPVYVSPKLDGIRCLVMNTGPVSRNLKPIANDFIRNQLSDLRLHGLDGELIVGSPTGNDVWNRSNSGVMKKTGKPDYTFHVFDDFLSHDVFFRRQNALVDRVHELSRMYGLPVVLVEQIKCVSKGQLLELEDRFVEQGYEGVMIRSPYGHYKFGRSTTKEGGLLKLKRFEDHEAEVLDCVERFHNGNAATKDALGRTKRSTAKAGKVGTNTLGALVCQFGRDVVFELGTGFTEQQRVELWKSPLPIGLKAKFKCQGFTPEDGKPRFPVFLGFRDERDMDRKSGKSR